MLLAVRFGLSDVALAKICRKNKIPTPYRGYWRKIEVGQYVASIPLVNPNLNETIWLPVGTSVLAYGLPPTSHSASTPVTSSEADVGSHDAGSAIPDLISVARQVARQAPKDQFGRLQLSKLDQLALTVAPATLPRAINLMSALSNKLAERGMRVSVVCHLTFVEVLGETLAIELVERCTLPRRSRSRRSSRVKRQLPPKPSGQLSLAVHEDLPGSITTRWNDTRHSRLEDRLEEIAAGLQAAAVAKLELAARQCDRPSQSEEPKSNTATPDEDAEFLADLEVRAEQWERLDRVRRFIAELERRVGADDRDEATKSWIERAKSVISGIESKFHQSPNPSGHGLQADPLIGQLHVGISS